MTKTAPPDAIGRLLAAPEIQKVLKAVKETGAVSASGLWGSSVAAIIAAIRQQLKRPVMLLCGHLDEADDLADDVQLFSGFRPEVLPALELSGSLGRISEEQVAARLRLISRLAAGGNSAPSTLVTPVQALMQSVPAKSELQHLIRTIKAGQNLEPEKLIVWLSDHGYNRLEQVEVPGDFAVRGGIIDIYQPGTFDDSDQVGQTLRLDFFGDQVETIKKFDIDTLGSSGKIESVSLFDIKGQLPDTSSTTHLFSYLDPSTVVVLWAPLEIAEQAKSYLDRLPEQKGVYPLSAVLKMRRRWPVWS